MTDAYLRRVALATRREWVATASFKQEAIVAISFEFVAPDVRHFSQDAADAPDIDFRIVVFTFQNDLWRSVPSCYHVAWDFTFGWVFVFAFFVTAIDAALLCVCVDLKTSVWYKIVTHVFFWSLN